MSPRHRFTCVAAGEGDWDLRTDPALLPNIGGATGFSLPPELARQR